MQICFLCSHFALMTLFKMCYFASLRLTPGTLEWHFQDGREGRPLLANIFIQTLNSSSICFLYYLFATETTVISYIRVDLKKLQYVGHMSMDFIPGIPSGCSKQHTIIFDMVFF